MVDSESADALSPLLSTVRLRASVFAAGELGAPWGVKTGGLDRIVCYTVLQGSALLCAQSARKRPFELAEGDLVFIRASVAHELKDSLKTHALPFEQIRDRTPSSSSLVRLGGSGARTRLVCGSLDMEAADRVLFETGLPKVTHLRREGSRPALRHIVAALSSEVAAPGPGSPLVLNRLAELLFVQLLRACAEDPDTSVGWLRGVGHPQLAASMAAIHRRPGEAWTLDRLAAEASMSRSSFAARFRETVGETPLAYVTSWRMRHAARLLESPEQSLKAVAAAVGYGSDEAFSRAFRAWAGVPPGVYRQQRHGTRPE